MQEHESSYKRSSAKARLKTSRKRNMMSFGSKLTWKLMILSNKISAGILKSKTKNCKRWKNVIKSNGPAKISIPSLVIIHVKAFLIH